MTNRNVVAVLMLITTLLSGGLSAPAQQPKFKVNDRVEVDIFMISMSSPAEKQAVLLK